MLITRQRLEENEARALALYDHAGYDLAVDYRRPCAPPLSPEDAAWAASLLQPIPQPTS